MANAIEVNGYYENLFVGGAKRDGGGLVGDLSRLRLRLDAKIADNVNLHLEPEYDFLIKSDNLPISSVSGLDQLTWDRAYLKLAFPLADITVGQQRIAWGAGYLWNPTDVFNPFTLSFAVDEDEESEPQAVRVEVPMGEAGGLDTYVETNKAWLSAAKGIRFHSNLGLYDFSLSYVDRGAGAFQLGADTTGELFGLGVRSEVALISPAAANRYIQSVLGGNYTFENGWGLDMEYYFNGLGVKNKDNYDWTNLLAGNISQLGMDYFYFAAYKALDEITNIRFSLLLNADDLSRIYYPTFSRNIFQNFDLSLEAMLTGGDTGSEFKPTLTQDTTGLMGSNLILLRFRYSF
ncbi:MAG: hypothetical protein KJ732_01550 [Candidatus Margulisbacteria bacterium]|nr:hypothetical protein [Candidatus Margulisiibacteriota bacterium]